MKKMFVVMEVENIIGNDAWVSPKGSWVIAESVLKSRVIYADSMTWMDGMDQMPKNPTSKWIAFHGVSFTPEPKDEWEEWIVHCPIGMDLPFGITEGRAVKDWLRKMPRGKS